MSGLNIIRILSIYANINGKWSTNDDISSKIVSLLNDNDGRHFTFNELIQIEFISANMRHHIIIVQENSCITRETIQNQSNTIYARNRLIDSTIDLLRGWPISAA